MSVKNKQYQTTPQKVTLGSVGSDATFDLERTYTSLGIPNYNVPIKVQVTPIAFSKATFKAFTKAQALQPSSVDIIYVDSLANNPHFLNIETSDKVGLIHLLNDTSNKDIQTYLQNQNAAHIVTNISMVLNEADMNEVIQANEVFIAQIGIKVIGLKLFNNSALTRTINFNDGVVFAYRTSSICWKENDKYQLKIADLVEGGSACPKQSYNSSKKAKKKVDYFKF